MTKGKVVLVPFPFDDLSTSKVRPAVCLTNPFGRYRHVVPAFVTSRVPSQPWSLVCTFEEKDTARTTADIKRREDVSVRFVRRDAVSRRKGGRFCPLRDRDILVARRAFPGAKHRGRCFSGARWNAPHAAQVFPF